MARREDKLTGFLGLGSGFGADYHNYISDFNQELSDERLTSLFFFETTLGLFWETIVAVEKARKKNTRPKVRADFLPTLRQSPFTASAIGTKDSLQSLGKVTISCFEVTLQIVETFSNSRQFKASPYLESGFQMYL